MKKLLSIFIAASISCGSVFANTDYLKPDYQLKVLQNINNPKDVKKLNKSQLDLLYCESFPKSDIAKIVDCVVKFFIGLNSFFFVAEKLLHGFKTFCNLLYKICMSPAYYTPVYWIYLPLTNSPSMWQETSPFQLKHISSFS